MRALCLIAETLQVSEQEEENYLGSMKKRVDEAGRGMPYLSGDPKQRKFIAPVEHFVDRRERVTQGKQSHATGAIKKDAAKQDGVASSPEGAKETNPHSLRSGEMARASSGERLGPKGKEEKRILGGGRGVGAEAGSRGRLDVCSHYFTDMNKI